MTPSSRKVGSNDVGAPLRIRKPPTKRGRVEADVEPDPKKLKFDMPVDIIIKDAGRKDREGNSYLAYFFQPRAA